jgi:hypothetical protein
VEWTPGRRPVRVSGVCGVPPLTRALAVVRSPLRRSGIFVEPINQETPFEPQRGGIKAARPYAAPTELHPTKGRRWGYKDIAPTELGEMPRQRARRRT